MAGLSHPKKLIAYSVAAIALVVARQASWQLATSPSVNWSRSQGTCFVTGQTVVSTVFGALEYEIVPRHVILASLGTAILITACL